MLVPLSLNLSVYRNPSDNLSEPWPRLRACWRPWSREVGVMGRLYKPSPVQASPSESQTRGIYRLQILDPEMFLQGPQRPGGFHDSFFFDVRSEGHPHHRPSKCLVLAASVGFWKTSFSMHGDLLTFKAVHPSTASPSCSQQPCPSLQLPPPPPTPHPADASQGAPKEPWLWSSRGSACSIQSFSSFSKPGGLKVPASIARGTKCGLGVNSVTGELGGVEGRPSSPSCSPGPVR